MSKENKEMTKEEIFNKISNINFELNKPNPPSIAVIKNYEPHGGTILEIRGTTTTLKSIKAKVDKIMADKDVANRIAMRKERLVLETTLIDILKVKEGVKHTPVIKKPKKRNWFQWLDII